MEGRVGCCLSCAYPHPDDIQLHEQQHPIKDHQQPREAEAQLREANGVVIELDKLDGLGDEGQSPVHQQGCRGKQGVECFVCVRGPAAEGLGGAGAAGCAHKRALY